jgi:hypothetical protein
MNMNSAVLRSDVLSSKKGESTSVRHKKKAKHEAVFNREAIDRALDESINESGEVLVYEVDMKEPEKSIQKIMEHVRRAK